MRTLLIICLVFVACDSDSTTTTDTRSSQIGAGQSIAGTNDTSDCVLTTVCDVRYGVGFSKQPDFAWCAGSSVGESIHIESQASSSRCETCQAPGLVLGEPCDYDDCRSYQCADQAKIRAELDL